MEHNFEVRLYCHLKSGKIMEIQSLILYLRWRIILCDAQADHKKQFQVDNKRG